MRTKVDAWAVLIVGAAVFVPLVIAIIQGDQQAIWIIAASIAVLAAVLFLIAVPCTYTIGEETLVVRSGLIRWRIALADINAIEPSRNPLSSPAWSLDRLKITWSTGGRDRSMLISPVRKSEFAEELRRRCGIEKQRSN